MKSFDLKIKQYVFEEYSCEYLGETGYSKALRAAADKLDELKIGDARVNSVTLRSGPLGLCKVIVNVIEEWEGGTAVEIANALP